LSKKIRNKLSDIRNKSLVTHIQPKSISSEQYRNIRTNLQFSSVDKNVQSILVTSPEAGDGKSTTSANLAVVLVQQGHKVLLIDADLRKPSAHYSFEKSNLQGLTNVITKEEQLESVIQQTAIKGLDLLSSGPIPPNPAELLNSTVMASVIEKAKEKYDYVVIDAPPIVPVTDAAILSAKCDGVVLVLLSGKTKKESSVKAKEQLANVGANILGVILNGVENKEMLYAYYYGDGK
jgi:capsular exopolysaccharide synthesis family protein